LGCAADGIEGGTFPRRTGAVSAISHLLMRRFYLMTRLRNRPAVLLFAVALSAWAQSSDEQPRTRPGNPPPSLLPGPNHEVVLLWSDGAPGSEGKTEGEKFRVLGDRLILSNVHRPSLTLYLPPANVATGAGVVLAPGGGFREIWITHEGYRVAHWLSQRGIAAFVLKYRLPREEGSDYTTLGHSLADIQRAIRTVRHRASEWSVDPERIGVMGFSAGGALAGLAGTHYNDPPPAPADEIDRLSARPAFQGLIYGTPFAPPMTLDAEITSDTPPVFLAAGAADKIAASYPDVYKRFVGAGVSAELHLWAGVPHGFGVQPDTPPAVAGWLDRFREWLFAQGFLSRMR
jgi:endo-1,4-beta-xylanase